MAGKAELRGLPVDVQVCGFDDLTVGIGREFRVDGNPIALFRLRDGTVRAVAGRCPHRGAPLADGMLAGQHVVCPYHAFRFDLSGGGCDQKDVCAVATYPAEVRHGQVFLTLPRPPRESERA